MVTAVTVSSPSRSGGPLLPSKVEPYLKPAQRSTVLTAFNLRGTENVVLKVNFYTLWAPKSFDWFCLKHLDKLNRRVSPRIPNLLSVYGIVAGLGEHKKDALWVTFSSCILCRVFGTILHLSLMVISPETEFWEANKYFQLERRLFKSL